MKKEIWRCSKIYIDESWLQIKNCGEILLVGALFCPPGENIETLLEKDRENIECVDTLHFSDLRGNKQLELAEKYIDTFLSSKSIFRIIAMPILKNEFKLYCNNEKWRLFTKAVKLILNYPYISSSFEIKLIKPKIFIENSTSYENNFLSIKNELEKSMSINQIYYDRELFKIDPLPIFSLIDKKVFESVQLVDILLGIFRASIIMPSNPLSYKFKLYEKSSKIFEKLYVKKQLYKLSNFDTKNKINFWWFNGCEKIFNYKK